MTQTIKLAVIPGDGIGGEVISAGVEVLPCRYGFGAEGIDWLGVAPVQAHGDAP